MRGVRFAGTVLVSVCLLAVLVVVEGCNLPAASVLAEQENRLVAADSSGREVGSPSTHRPSPEETEPTPEQEPPDENLLYEERIEDRAEVLLGEVGPSWEVPYKSGEWWPMRNVNTADLFEPLIPLRAVATEDWGRVGRSTALPLGLIAGAFAARSTDRRTLFRIMDSDLVGHDDDAGNYPSLGATLLVGGLTFLLPHPGDGSSASWWHRRLDRLTVFGASAALALGITEILKRSIDRVRPSRHLTRGDPTFKSRPSGHATAAFVGSTFASQMLREWIRPHRIRSIPLRIGAELAVTLPHAGAAYAALSRVHNGKHYLTDVLLGAGVAILTTEMLYAWSFRPDAPDGDDWLDDVIVLFGGSPEGGRPAVSVGIRF